MLKRKQNASLLLNKLSDLTEYLILPQVKENVNSSWFGFLITLKDNCKFTKQQLVEYLEKNGIGTRQLFAGNILRQPSFAENDIELKINNSDILHSNKLTEDDFQLLPNTDYIMNNTFWVGVHPSLCENEINKISFEIHKFIEENK